MNFIRQIFIGIIIGGGMILPGVSGGVLAVIFGIYEDLLDAITHFHKNIKKNFYFLLPLVIGFITGVLLVGKILFFVFGKYPMEAQYTFIGLILGGLPILFKETTKKGNKNINYVALTISFIIAVSLFVLGKGTLDIDFSSNIDGGLISLGLLFITGFIFIAGKIIPGISSSFLLMLIGMYQYLLNILNDPFGLTNEEYFQIIPIVLGMIIGAIGLMNFMQQAIKNHFTLTYSIIIGFIIGSITAIYPGFSFDFHGLTSIILLIISFIIIYKFTFKGYNKSKINKSIDK